MKLKIINVIIIIVLLCMISICTFATVVTDNDGAAFVTKPEFDSLRIKLQNELDAFNKEIDMKIDQAIVDYLKGVNASKKSIRRVNIIYDNLWKWSSSRTATYDSNKNKYLYLSARFCFRTAYDLGDNSGGYTGVTIFRPFEKEARTYETFEKTTNVNGIEIWNPVKILFRLEAVLYFGRTSGQMGSARVPGNVLWHSFWPEQGYEKKQTHTSSRDPGGWWYDGHNMIYVDYDETYDRDVIIYPYSTGVSYYYLQGQKIIDVNERGSVVSTLNGVSREDEGFWTMSAAPSSMRYFPNQLVNADTNKNIVTNDMRLASMIRVSDRNDLMKYGACIGVMNSDAKSKFDIKINPSAVGTVYFAVGDTAVNCWDDAMTHGKWQYNITVEDVGKNITISSPKFDNIRKDDGIYFIYAPTDANNAYTVEINEITMEG